MAKRAGRKPYGWYADDLVVIELLFLKANRRPHGKTQTLRQISDSLNSDGHRTQTGKEWYPIAVGRIIAKGLEYYRELHDKIEKPEHETRKKAKPVVALTQKEIDICRGCLIDSDRVLFEVLFGAGVRAAECCDLRVNDINIYDGNSYIDVQNGKGAKPRHVKIDSFLRKILTDYIFCIRKEDASQIPLFLNNWKRQLTYSNLYDRVKKLQRRAGIKYMHPHKLRHTYAAHLFHYTKHLEYVREQLGHATITITQIYINTLDISKLDMQEMFGEGTQTKL